MNMGQYAWRHEGLIVVSACRRDAKRPKSAFPREAWEQGLKFAQLAQHLVTTLRVVTHIFARFASSRQRNWLCANMFRARDAKRPKSAFPREAWERGRR